MISLWKKKQALDQLPDEELVRLYITKGDKRYFGEIYKRYSSMVYGTCLKYLKNKDEAYDTAMDIFETLIDKLLQQKNIRNFNIWIYHVTKNECFSRIKIAKKTLIEPLNESFVEKNSDHFMENDGFLTLINEQSHVQEENVVMNAINRLKQEQKACIIAFYLDKMSYKEIEDQLGYSFVKVKSHIQNGKRNLKIILEEAQIRT
jgi:RNA polymerase sigma factor (sigma-70 family)